VSSAETHITKAAANTILL